MPLIRTFAAVISVWLLGLSVAVGQENPPPPSVSEIPATFTPKTDSFDSHYYVLAERAGDENSRDYEFRSLLSLFLHHVGTAPWERMFGRHWDECVQREREAA